MRFSFLTGVSSTRILTGFLGDLDGDDFSGVSAMRVLDALNLALAGDDFSGVSAMRVLDALNLAASLLARPLESVNGIRKYIVKC